jgi:hypothetical protein
MLLVVVARQTLFMAKQPPVRLMLPAKVEVAVVDVATKWSAVI